MDISHILPRSALRGSLEALVDLYRRADHAVEAFRVGSGLSCSFGCGTCCEAFVPDILPVEAELVAVALVRADSDKAFGMAANGLQPRVRADGRTGCPLYADDTPYHCTVYEARPLICRMFAFSGVRDKLGLPSYSPCKLMPRRLPLASDPAACGFGPSAAPDCAPPVMSDFGSELVSIDPSSSSGRRSLHEALPDALSRVLFLARMAAERDPDNEGPDQSPPLPSAG